MLRFYFLGVPRIERDDRPVELPAKAVALLAYLAGSAGPVPRDRILGLLWGESAEDAARKNLRNTLWTIRRGLGDGVLLTEGDRLTLSGDVWVDHRGWPPADASADAALALYRGPFLDGLTVNEASEYELWLMMERERLTQSFLRAVAAAIRLHQARGAWRDVLAVARRGLAQDNLHEPFYRALMEAHARLGERAEALRQYEVLRSLLERELGVQAAAGNRGAGRSALPDLAAGATTSEHEGPTTRSACSPSSAPCSAPPAESHPFIGRSHELAALSEEYDQRMRARRGLSCSTASWASARRGSGTNGRGAHGPRPPRPGGPLPGSVHQDLPFTPLTDVLSDDVRLAEIARRPRSACGWQRPLRGSCRSCAAIPTCRDRPRCPLKRNAATSSRRWSCSWPPSMRIPWCCSSTTCIGSIRPLDWLAYLVHRLRDRGLFLVLTYRPEEAQPISSGRWQRGIGKAWPGGCPRSPANPDEAALVASPTHLTASRCAAARAWHPGNRTFCWNWAAIRPHSPPRATC